MAIDVTILTVEPTDNSLDITVNVSTAMLDVIDYEININDTGTGGNVTRSGTLDGKGGNRRGDEVIHEVSFGLNPPEQGTVTAQVTSPEEYVGIQDQQPWEKAGGSVTINECDSQPTSSGDLEVTYTLTPSIGAEQTEREVTIRVDGQAVGSATHTIPGRTITRSQTIPADDLPTGEEMPVGIGVGGDFSDCGTATVGGAADGSITASDCSVSASGGTVTATVDLSGTAPAGEVVLTLLSGGVGPFDTIQTDRNLAGKTVEITGEPDWGGGEHQVEIEAAVIDSNGDVLDVSVTECGTVTLGAEDEPQEPQEPAKGSSQTLALLGTVGAVAGGVGYAVTRD